MKKMKFLKSEFVCEKETGKKNKGTTTAGRKKWTDSST
jgi:hypothetical protein